MYGLDIETDTTVDGLDPEVAAVVTVALSNDGFDEVFTGDEEAILHDLDARLAAVAPGVIATWNGAAFDLPFLADRAALHGIPCERMSVVPLAGDTEEKRAGLDGARLVGEVGDLDRSALDDVRWGERFDDALQVHLRGESTNGVSRHRRRDGAISRIFAAIS